MNCPRCQNINFMSTDEFRKPIIVHATKYEDKFNYRILICIQCGYAWETIENFSREIEIRGIKVMRMIENAKEVLAEAKRSSKNKKSFFKKHNNQGKLF